MKLFPLFLLSILCVHLALSADPVPDAPDANPDVNANIVASPGPEASEAPAAHTPVEETVHTPVSTRAPAPSAQPAQTPAPAADPEREPRALFEAGVEAFGAQKYTRAVAHFERLLREFPSSSFRLDALFHLGQSHYRAGAYAEAIKPLQATIELDNRGPTANEARVLIGNAYLELNKNSEAFLVSEELLRQKDLRSTLRGRALLIRAQAQSALNQPIESKKTFTIFQAVADQDPELERELARSYLVSLLMKSAECEKLPTLTALPEEQLLDQLNRKSVCLLEMGALLSKSARTLSSEDLKQGSDLVLKGYRSYSRHCEHPPLTRDGRTEEQLKIARAELAQKLKESCQSTFELLMESLKDRDSARSLKNSLRAR